MDQVEVRTRKIEIDQEKMEYKNSTYNEEITYWKKAALARLLNESDEKELVDLAPPRVLLIRKDKIEKAANIDETIFYLKSVYSRTKNFYWWYSNRRAFFWSNDQPFENFSKMYQRWWKYELKK